MNSPALSIQQPWSWLIVHGKKSIENRTWRSNFRGDLLIHAGQKIDPDGYEFAREMLPDVNIPGPNEIERGGIVGSAFMTDCVTEHESPWFFGPYGFVLRHAHPIAFKPCRGMLGIFDVDYEALEAPWEAEKKVAAQAEMFG